MANTCVMGYFLSSNFIFFNRYLFTVRRLSIQIFIPCNDKKKTKLPRNHTVDT